MASLKGLRFFLLIVRPAASLCPPKVIKWDEWAAIASMMLKASILLADPTSVSPRSCMMMAGRPKRSASFDAVRPTMPTCQVGSPAINMYGRAPCFSS